MKKFLLITFIASMFAAGSAFAHCGSCGVEATDAHSHAEKADCKTDCKADCTKPCCAKKAEKADCEKPCCKKAEAASDETAAAAPSACCASKAGKPA